jgi:micrococcal nuclease
LPTPSSPTTATTCPRPCCACLSARPSCSISESRPTNRLSPRVAAAWRRDRAAAAHRLLATVVHITDGDTLWAEIAVPGHGLAPREKTRLVGIDCPERGQAPWGAHATARLSALLLGKPIEIEVALQSRDCYGRLLGSIWHDGVLVQEQLVREGPCVPYVVPPNVEHVDRIRAAAEQARRDGLGIYARELPASRIPAGVPPAPVEHCSAVCA